MQAPLLAAKSTHPLTNGPIITTPTHEVATHSPKHPRNARTSMTPKTLQNCSEKLCRQRVTWGVGSLSGGVWANSILCERWDVG